MPRFLSRLAVLTCLLAVFSLQALAQTAVSVQTDRENALYAVSDPVTFAVQVLHDGSPVTEGEVAFELSIDGWKTLESGMLPLSSEPSILEGTLDTPGFLRCTVTYTAPGGTKTIGVGAAGFDPLEIKPSLPVPDDFDTFWAEKKALLAEVPMNPILTPVESTVESVACFDVQLDCLGGAPVSGYLARPADAAPKSLPAILYVHGAGVRSSSMHADSASKGLLTLDINAHGIPNGKPSAFYEELAKGHLKDYRTAGREDRETIYFLGMYYRLLRAMDFLTAQPEWDGKVLMVMGSSQGGGQALVAAGLDTRVTALISNVPAMCEHTGPINGWPRLVPRDAEGTPDPKIQEVARYFDAMNFATRTEADALVGVGFIDNTCRPTTVYAAYNNLRGTKQMLNKPHMAHAIPPEWNAMAMKFIAEHIANR